MRRIERTSVWVVGVAALATAIAAGCRSAPWRPPARVEPPRSLPLPERRPPPQPTRTEPRRETRPLVVTAWAEPRYLPPGGGQVQVIVRVRWRGGAPAPGIEVRIDTNRGTLYSGGQILSTDSSGQTRDRLTTRRTATVTVNAGGTRISFPVAVLPREAAS